MENVQHGLVKCVLEDRNEAVGQVLDQSSLTSAKQLRTRDETSGNLARILSRLTFNATDSERHQRIMEHHEIDFLLIEDRGRRHTRIICFALKRSLRNSFQEH